MRLLAKEILSSLPPFTGLKKRQIEHLLNFCVFREYAPHQVVYREGDPPDRFYLLLKGRLLALSRQDGKSQGIELIKRGTPFGLISLFTDDPHSVTVQAMEPSVVLEIDKEDFRQFVHKVPHAALEFSRILSQKVKKRAGEPKKIFQSLKLGVCAAAHIRCAARYMVDLAAALYEETGKRIIVLELSSQDSFILPSVSGRALRLFPSREIEQGYPEGYIEQADWAYLCVRLDPGFSGDIFTLFNELNERFHFIFFLWNLDEEESLLQNYLLSADILHCLSNGEKEEARQAEKLRKSLAPRGPRSMEQIVCECGQLSPQPQIPAPYASLPQPENPGYRKVLKRISRELGEKTVGLVLGSGAAFGLAHIGVIKVLEQEKIPIDIVSGTSMGALVATLWGLGYQIDEIEKIALDFGRKLLFSSFASFVFPFKGFLKSRNLEKLLRDIYGNRTFRDLKRRVRVCSFDFIKREQKVIEEGPLYKAVAASCAMPGVFEPITYQEQIFLDGGILAPLPVQSVMDYAKKVIAVNVTPSREEIIRETRNRKYKKFTILDFIFGSVETMQREFIEEAKKSADVVIHPDMAGLSWVEFNKVAQFIKRGESATRDQMAEVKKLIQE